MGFNSERSNPMELQPKDVPGGLHPYSAEQLLFLLRLACLLRQKQEYEKLLQPDDWRVKLLHKVIYSTFCDCVEQGVAEDARTLFERDRANNKS